MSWSKTFQRLDLVRGDREWMTASDTVSLKNVQEMLIARTSRRRETRSRGYKGKEHRTPWRVLVGCSSPLLRPWARRWINHSSLWRIASATPDLRLPSQSQDVADPRLVPNYTAWWQSVWTTCLRSLPDSGSAGSWTLDLSSRSQRLTHYTTRPHHVDMLHCNNSVFC